MTNGRIIAEGSKLGEIRGANAQHFLLRFAARRRSGFLSEPQKDSKGNICVNCEVFSVLYCEFFFQSKKAAGL
jgi:hypothetical protein